MLSYKPLTKKGILLRWKEWKVDQGKVFIVVRALYGLKSSALQFGNCLAEALGYLLPYLSKESPNYLVLKPSKPSRKFNLWF